MFILSIFFQKPSHTFQGPPCVIFSFTLQIGRAQATQTYMDMTVYGLLMQSSVLPKIPTLWAATAKSLKDIHTGTRVLQNLDQSWQEMLPRVCLEMSKGN